MNVDRSRRVSNHGLRLLIVAMLALVAGANGDSQPPLTAEQRLEQMSAGELQRIRRNQEKFNALPRAEQERLRELNAAIEADPELGRVLHDYYEWLTRRPPSEQTRLQKLAVNDRAQEVNRLRGREFNRREVFPWLLGEAHEALEHRESFDDMSDDDRRHSAFRLIWDFPDDDHGARWNVTPEDWTKLAERLPEAAKRELEGAKSDSEKSELVRDWLREGRSGGVYYVQRDPNWRERYEGMDENEKRRLMSRGSDEVAREFMSYRGGRWPEDGPPPGMGPGMGGGPGRGGPPGPRDGRPPFGRGPGPGISYGERKYGPDGPPGERGLGSGPDGWRGEPGPGHGPDGRGDRGPGSNDFDRRSKYKGGPPRDENRSESTDKEASKTDS